LIPVAIACAGLFEQSVGARNQEGIGLTYWLARLHRLAELIPWNRFLGSLKVKKFRLSLKGKRIFKKQSALKMGLGCCI
jgi:hypothetical protein